MSGGGVGGGGGGGGVDGGTRPQLDCAMSPEEPEAPRGSSVAAPSGEFREYASSVRTLSCASATGWLLGTGEGCACPSSPLPPPSSCSAAGGARDGDGW